MKEHSEYYGKYNTLFLYSLSLSYSDTYVTAESGTGVVHQAPGFGEDDFRVSLRYNVFKKGSSVLCPVDASGCFTNLVTDFAGQYVKVLLLIIKKRLLVYE